jgi:Ni,Fe-hydrogenase III large subunit
MSPFPLLLVIDLVQETIKKVSRDFLEILERILSDKNIVPRSKAISAEFS